VELVIISPFLRVFIVGHSFVTGLASDNLDQESIQATVQELRRVITEECTILDQKEIK
jgi:hypothetical protein